MKAKKPAKNGARKRSAIPRRAPGAKAAAPASAALNETFAQPNAELARAYAEAIVRTTKEALVVLDARLNVHSANPAFYQVSGLTPETVVGRSLFVVGHGQWNLPALRAALQQTLPKRKPFKELQLSVPLAAGTRVLLLSGHVMEDPAGGAPRILLTMHDVSELSQAHDRLRQLANELTRSEEQERQRIAQVLHDHLQQLLVGARYHLDIIAHRAEAAKLSFDIERVAKLLDESVDAARSLSHELSPPVLRDGSLAAAMRWLVNWMHEKHSLVIRLEWAPEAEPRESNLKIMLFHSIRELLLNIVKHSGVRRAAVRAALDEASRITITVSDQGRGFDPETLQRATSGGQGLGLFTIRERLVLLGGSLEIQSQLGQGTQFILRVPLGQWAGDASAPPAADAGRTPEAQAPQTAARDAHLVRIVLADDHKVMREGLATLLDSEAGFVVVGSANNGEEAVALARQLKPDLILMDISMPKLSGIEATARIKAAQPKIRVLGLTMHDSPDMHSEMRQAGAVGCLVKSAPTAELIQGIRDAMTAEPGKKR